MEDYITQARHDREVCRDFLAANPNQWSCKVLRDVPAKIERKTKMDGRPDYVLSAEQLDYKYNPAGGGQHPRFTRWDWKQEVASESTLRGYWEWVASKLEEEFYQNPGAA